VQSNDYNNDDGDEEGEGGSGNDGYNDDDTAVGWRIRRWRGSSSSLH